MRLSFLGEGQSLLQRALFGFIRLTSGGAVPGPLCALSYRSSFFGTEYGKLLDLAMRSQEHWSLGEVELFAAWVSTHNECAF